MNERFAADPFCFHNCAEVQSVLQCFGVHTGRYLANYPEDWEQRLATSPSLAKPVVAARVSTLLRRAKERCGLVSMPSLMWMDHLSWVENANKLTTQSPPMLDGLVVPNETARVPLKASTLDNFELPPTAEERIASIPSEYVRVSERLLQTSHELALVDPYLNPCDRYVAPVFESLLAEAAKGKCRLINCFARERDVLSASVTRDAIKNALKNMLNKVAIGKPIRFNYYLLDDTTSRDRMHDRYLLSVKGGIEFSQGFQKQRRDGKVTASPMSPTLHKEIWSIFQDKKTDMRFNSAIVVP
jgi:hypothetical protein